MNLLKAISESIILLVSLGLAMFWIYCWYATSRVMPFGSDAGYHLSMALRLQDSAPVFSEMPSLYTPLTYFLWLISGSLAEICGIDIKVAHWWTPFFVQLGIGAAVFRLLQKMKVRNSLSALAAVSMLYSISASEGFFPSLESFVALFSLLALLMVIDVSVSNARYFFAGTLVACAFLSKQYGLTALIPVMFIPLINLPLKRSLKNIYFILAGFAIFTIASFTTLSLVYEVTFESLFDQFFLQKYLSESLNFDNLFTTLTKAGPYIFFPILMPLFFLRSSEVVRKRLLIMTVATFSFLLPLLKRTYPHYYILFWPCLACLVAIELDLAWNEATAGSKRSAIIAVLGFILFLLAPLSFLRQPLYGLDNCEYKSLGDPTYRKVCDSIPQQSKVFILGDPLLMYFCNFMPSEQVNLGYAFPIFYSDDEIMKAITKSKILVVDWSTARTTEMLSRFHWGPEELAKHLSATGYLKKRHFDKVEIFELQDN